MNNFSEKMEITLTGIMQEVSALCGNIAEIYMRPSVVYRANIKRSSTGLYTAYIEGFYAEGYTPQEAMKNFDNKWNNSY